MASNDRLELGDTVRIKEYIGDEYNEYARVVATYADGDVWVANLNMPYQGTISKKMSPDEVEKVR